MGFEQFNPDVVVPPELPVGGGVVLVVVGVFVVFGVGAATLVSVNFCPSLVVHVGGVVVDSVLPAAALHSANEVTAFLLIVCVDLWLGAACFVLAVTEDV
jgi:hypothetical protein